jgi:hypothetical protein
VPFRTGVTVPFRTGLTVPFRSGLRNLDGFLACLPPGERAAAQDSSTRCLARVTPM